MERWSRRVSRKSLEGAAAFLFEIVEWGVRDSQIPEVWDRNGHCGL
jgi:hypothetical protein